MADPVSQTTSREIDWKSLVDEERAKEVPAYVPVDYRWSNGKEAKTVDEFYTS